jgi:hypothetical protein
VLRDFEIDSHIAGSRRAHSEPYLFLIIMCIYRSMSLLSLADVSSLQPNLCSPHVLLTTLTFWHTLGDVGPSIMSFASSRSCHLNAIDVV